MAGAHRIDIMPLHRQNIFQRILPGNHPPALGAELVPVDSLKHNPLSIQIHNTVFYFKTPETDILQDHLLQCQVFIINLDQKPIQIRRLRTPELRLLQIQHIPVFSRRQLVLFDRHTHILIRQLSPETASGLIEGKTDMPCLFPAIPPVRNVQTKLQHAFLHILGQLGLRLHIPHMNLRCRIQIHIPENPGKTIKILILTPASRSPFKDLRRQLVFSLLQIRAQKKLRRCEAVLTVPHKMPVQPDRYTALGTLKGNIHAFFIKFFRHLEILHITCHRVKPLWHLSGRYLLPAVPGILHIRVLWKIVALHLDMGRHSDIIPALTIIRRLLKPGYGTFIVFRIMKFPDTV